MKMVSACLAGINCRYDGENKENMVLKNLVIQGEAVALCPEVMGGLATPRLPAEIVGGDGEAVWCGQARVIDQAGNDVTKAYLAGAEKALKMLQQLGIDTVILKEKSPSCGACHIYDGTFTGKTKAGLGVAAALFKRNGINVRSDENFNEQTG
ncbi:DUF523 domain-containing protein [Listeria costaricensis]|uniref:DUF523 domain-containing protein n=1 Tax=Listeria costaricensis TaxID=2026604 RepID=UPI000C08A58E|nr:DUF523 domain-containing protein [Listeria costaricensis]